MGVHQWHVQAGHSQFRLTCVSTLAGRGSHSEGHCVKYGGRRRESTHPSLPAVSFTPVLTNKQTPDSRCQSLNLIQTGFQTSPACRTATCFFAESRLTNQTPLSATLLICMMLGTPSLQYSSHPKDKQLTDAINSALLTSLLYSNPFYSTVDSTAVNSVLLALLLTGL